VDLPRIAANQQRTFLALWAEVRPHLASDSALPRRIKDLLGRNRAFGSRDRRLYRELLYTGIRFLPWIDPLMETRPEDAAAVVAWLAPSVRETEAYRGFLTAGWPVRPETLTERSAVLRGRLSSNGPQPAGAPGQALSAAGLAPAPQVSLAASPLPFDPEALLPAWFREHCPQAYSPPHLDALNERARLWMRLQCRETSVVLDEFLARGWAVRLDPGLPEAVSLPPNAEVAATDSYRRGFVEIQDLGSQLVLRHAPDLAGQSWLDACAGAGGKTLQIARLVGERGRVDAADIRSGALDELRDRLGRARLGNVHIVASPAGGYDGVLVDAPCSGSGTWRRLPHMKWYTRPRMIAEFAADQLRILAENSARVRAGGLLVYATCSLSHHENHDVAAAFLGLHPEFAPEPPARDWGAVPDGLGHTLFPGTRDSDGFYVALLRRRA